MQSILPYVALNAATADGASTVVDLNGVSNEFSLIVVATGTPTGGYVSLQGSHDGVNWASIGVSSNLSSTPYAASSELTNGQISGSTPGATYKPFVRYVRANLIGLSGGTSPTVTATIAVGHII